MKEPIYVKKSRLGRGVFAARDIGKGEKICAMRGKKIDADHLSKVTTSGRNILVDPLQISDRLFINMKEPYVLVNHSCNPNAGIKSPNTLVAIKNIVKDEEILYDYSSVWYEGFECSCGNKNCRRFIGGFFALPKSAQRKYIKLGIVSEFIEKKMKKLG